MNDNTTITLLITACTGLVAAVGYLYKRGEKREKEVQQMIKDVLNTIRANESVVREADEVLKRVEKLLTNWRAH